MALEFRERVGKHVQFCGYRFEAGHFYKKEGESCNQAVVPGGEYCWVHQPGLKRRVIDRLDKEQKRIAKNLFLGGATGKTVAAAIGITPGQANTVKRYLGIPIPNSRRRTQSPPARLPERDLECVAEIKTERGWVRMFGTKRSFSGRPE